jgi:hypothetical protein
VYICIYLRPFNAQLEAGVVGSLSQFALRVALKKNFLDKKNGILPVRP